MSARHRASAILGEFVGEKAAYPLPVPNARRRRLDRASDDPRALLTQLEAIRSDESDSPEFQLLDRSERRRRDKRGHCKVAQSTVGLVTPTHKNHIVGGNDVITTALESGMRTRWSNGLDWALGQALKVLPATPAAAVECPPPGYYTCFTSCEFDWVCFFVYRQIERRWILPNDQFCPATSQYCDYACTCTCPGCPCTQPLLCG